MNKKMTCERANQLSIISFLDSLGHQPKAIKGNCYWYLSPFRIERTASFKVDTSINRWYDHGIAVGGKLVDLGIRMWEVDVVEFLEKVQALNISSEFSFQHPTIKSPLPVIKSVKPLQNKALLSYMIERGIGPIWLAKLFCQEVYFSIDSKNYFGIGFKNDLGGFEIRNRYFKGCIGSKGITTISRSGENAKTFALFEGFFDFLSAYQLGGQHTSYSYIILNSVNQIGHAVAELHTHEAKKVYAFFDNDEAGRKCFNTLSLEFPMAEDCSNTYQAFKDLNEMTMKSITP